ncbi:MAG: chloride channel protein [Caldiserica bacterium]|nr:chloride channel protein [Caldisericota bacterium]
MGTRGSWARIFRVNLRLCGLAVAIGALAGFGAVLFRWFIFWVGDLAYYRTLSRAYLPPSEHGLGAWAVLVPALGGFLVGLITRYLAPETRGHGVPEVMAAVATQGGRIRPRVALAKILASGICIGTGGSAGREGPIVQIGSALGSAIGQFLKLPPGELKVLVGCGAAGGIAATFNAPLAGVIFSVEVILVELRTRSFVPLVISSTIATMISRAFLGPEPAFAVPPYSLRSPWELLLYLGLGLGAALVGLAETRLLYGVEDLFDLVRIPVPAKAALGGLLLGAIALAVPQVLGTGYETVDRILAGTLPPVPEAAGAFLGLSLAKMLALAITLGSGGSGGVFAPSLFVGAAFGASFGVAMNLLLPGITAPYPAYALVGMAAVFSAASRATLSSIVMLFEMTRNYEIILPLMFACVVADVVAWSVSRETIYTLKLSRRGIRLSPEMEINWLRLHTVSDVMRRSVEVVPEDAAVAEVRARMERTGHPSFPVVDRSGRLVGIVTHREILRSLGRAERPGRDRGAKPRRGLP